MNNTINMTRKLTDAQKKQIAAMLLNGKSAASIAREFNVSDKTILYYAKKYNISTKHKKAKKTVTAADKRCKVANIDEFVSLYNSGLSYNELADKYDIDSSAVAYYVNKAEKEGKDIKRRNTERRDRAFVANDAAVDVIVLWCSHETYATISQRTKLPQVSVKKIVERFLSFKEEVIESEDLPSSYSSDVINKITLMYLSGRGIKDILRTVRTGEKQLNIYLDKLDAFFRRSKSEIHESAVENSQTDNTDRNSTRTTVIKFKNCRLEIRNCPKDLVDILRKISDNTVNLNDINTISDILSNSLYNIYTMTKEVR